MATDYERIISEAIEDCGTIQEAVNEVKIVSPRYGEDFKSLPMISAEFQISSDAAEAAAVLAEESANIATSAAQNASSSANIAEAAATAATISASVFETPEAGVDPVTGVADGEYYNVRSSSNESYIDEYQNVGGVATPTGKSYPSSAALNNIPHNNLKDRDASGAHPASAILDESGVDQQEINNSVIYQCDTVADLATIFPRGANHIVHVRRYSATSKWVGGQDYRWDAASAATVNDFETIASPFSTNGRWKAVFKNNVMNAWSLGYFGDGTTDNAARHKVVSKWMHENNETRKLIFSNGEFLFNGESGNFFLVSNTDYQIKPTAKITGGSSFDDNGIYFGTSYDNNQYLTNVKVYGGGTFDMSGTGYMRTAYHMRTVIFIPKQDKVTFDGITFTGGDFVWSIVTGATLREYDQENCVIKNCTFDFHMVDMPDSKNSDFTAIYVNTPNATIRNNTFNAKSVRAKMLGTAVEFHHHGGSLLNNTFNDVGVGTYIAQQEQVHTNDTIIQGNKGTCTGLFVAYWSDGGVQRYALRNSIIGNTIKQRNFPSSAEQSAIGLVPRSSGLSFIAFIHTDPTENQLPLITGGLTISGNSFTHSQVDAASTFINFISQAPHGISVIGNDLRVANLITTPSGRLSKPISKLTMRQNTINGEYLSSSTSPVSFRANSVTNCVIDLSDITYETLSNKNIPLITWDVASTGNYLNTIIEGEYSYPTYSTVSYPADFFAGSNANTVSHVFSANINIPAATVAGAVLASVNVDMAINSKLRVLSANIGLESTLTLPVYLSRRSSALAYTGVGYTTQAIAAPTNISAIFYTTRA